MFKYRMFSSLPFCVYDSFFNIANSSFDARLILCEHFYLNCNIIMFLKKLKKIDYIDIGLVVMQLGA